MVVPPSQGLLQEDQGAHAVTVRQARSAQAEGWPLAVLDRVLAPAGVRLLAVDGPRRDPLGATAGEDRPTSAEGSTAAAGQPRRCRAGSRPPRVLLVDDSRAMRRVLRGLLEDAGIPVVGEAGDGAQGVELAEEQLCAAVLAAWQPPAGPS